MRGTIDQRVDQVGSTVFAYDANNNRTNVSRRGDECLTFDAYDRVSTYKDADGNLMQYRYDASGNMTTSFIPATKR